MCSIIGQYGQYYLQTLSIPVKKEIQDKNSVVFFVKYECVYQGHSFYTPGNGVLKGWIFRHKLMSIRNR